MNVAALLQDSPSEDRRRTNSDIEKRTWTGSSTTPLTATAATTSNTWPPTPAPATTTSSTTPPTTTNNSSSSSSTANWTQDRERTYHDNHKQSFPTTNSPNIATRYGVGVGDPSPMYEPPARKPNSSLTSSPGDRGKSPWGLAMRPGSTGNNLPMDRDQQWERERDWVRDRNYAHRQVPLPERPPTTKRSSQEELHYEDGEIEDRRQDMHVLQHSRAKSPRQWMPPPHFTPTERDRMSYLPPPQMIGRHEYPHRQPIPPLHHPRSDPQNNDPLPQKLYQSQFHTSFVTALKGPPPLAHHMAPNSRLGSPMPPLFVDSRQDGRPIPHDIQREREQRDRERRRANSLVTKPKPTREGHRRYDDQRLPYSNPPYPENWARERERERDREQRERERQVQLQQHPPPKRINEPPFTGPPPPHHPQHYPHPDELDPRLQPHRSSNYVPPPINHRSSGVRVHPAPEPIEWEREREFKARQVVHVGSFVWPKTPFPYFFPSVTLKPKDAEDSIDGEVKEKENAKPSIESTVNGEKEKETGKEDGKPPLKPSTTPNKPSTPAPPTTATENDVVDTDTRATIYIPSGFLPSSKLDKPVGKIWGGGLNPPPGRVLTPPKSSKSKHRSQLNGHSRSRKGKQKEDGRDEKPQRRRRIYTDDSDLFLCTLHSGFVTWSGVSKAKSAGMDLKLDVRILRVEGAKVLRSAYSPTQVPARPSAIMKKDDLKRLRREEVITHFVGGVGEKYFGGDRPKPAAEAPTTEEDKVFERTIKIPERDEDVGDTDKALMDVDPAEDWESDEEDDGRGIESCSWGSGHDGSGIEIVGVEFVKHGTAHQLGRQNRSQRMREYALQRNAVFTPKPAIGVKRQRTPPGQMRVLNATVIEPVAAELEDYENERLIPGPLRCSTKEEGCMKRSVLVGFGEQPWFKYNPQVLKDTLFPSDDEDEIRNKKRKICASGGMDVDGTDDLPSSSRSVLLQSRGRACYIVSPRGEKQYTLSKLENTSIAEVLWNDLSEDRLHFSNEGLSVGDASNLIPVQRWKWTT